jgi:hypothetical protein
MRATQLGRIEAEKWVIQGERRMYVSKSDTGNLADQAGQTWPVGARWAVSGLILFHVAAVLAGSLGAAPSSDLEHETAELFGPYHQLLNQGVGYHYYSTAFPPTPVVTATLSFADGRPDRVVRIPERGIKPRLLYQRQLAMAHYLMEDFEAAKAKGDGSQSHWAHAFATHIGKTNPGCKTVTLRLEMKMVPRLERVNELLGQSGSAPVDLDADEFSTAPERIGVYPCEGY